MALYKCFAFRTVRSHYKAPNNIQTCFSRRCRLSVTMENWEQVLGLEVANVECGDFDLQSNAIYGNRIISNLWRKKWWTFDFFDILSSRAASSTFRVKSPGTSIELTSGMSPCLDKRPYVGFRPTSPQNDAGLRVEPPVSEPSALHDAYHITNVILVGFYEFFFTFIIYSFMV